MADESQAGFAINKWTPTWHEWEISKNFTCLNNFRNWQAEIDAIYDSNSTQKSQAVPILVNERNRVDASPCRTWNFVGVGERILRFVLHYIRSSAAAALVLKPWIDLDVFSDFPKIFGSGSYLWRIQRVKRLSESPHRKKSKAKEVLKELIKNNFDFW